MPTSCGPEPDLVTTVTWCPRSASVLATPDPIGPAPTTTCLIFASASLSLRIESGALYSESMPHDSPLSQEHRSGLLLLLLFRGRIPLWGHQDRARRGSSCRPRRGRHGLGPGQKLPARYSTPAAATWRPTVRRGSACARSPAISAWLRRRSTGMSPAATTCSPS